MKRSTKETLKRRMPAGAFRAYHRGRDLVRAVRRILFRFTHPGKMYRCNLCGRSHGRFMPAGEKFRVHDELDVVGAGYRDNCVCPACSSKDRERLLLEFLKAKTGLFREKTALLHIAPERNLEKILMSIHPAGYVRADLGRKDVDVRMDVTRLPFPEGRFGAVLCNHVLEHVPDDRGALREIFRVLKTDGWAVLQVPIGRKLAETIENPASSDPGERERRFGQIDHVRIYGPDYEERLRKAGFAVKIFHAADFLSEEPVRGLALDPEEPVFYVTKPSPA